MASTGIGGIRGHWELLGGVGMSAILVDPSGVSGGTGPAEGIGQPSGGVGCQGCIEGLAGCKYSGASRGRGSIKGHWGS